MADWDDLLRLVEQWKELFDEVLPIGPSIGPEDVPLIQQCIDEQSKKPLERHFEKLAEQGIVL